MYYIKILGNNVFRIERININIPLTLDTYRPPLHPYNFINLLCQTKYGFNFLIGENFIQYCVDVIRGEEVSDKYVEKVK